MMFLYECLYEDLDYVEVCRIFGYMWYDGEW